MLKDYIYNGRRYQFEDNDVPEGAVLVSAEKVTVKAVEVPKNKEAAPVNKSKKVAKK